MKKLVVAFAIGALSASAVVVYLSSELQSRRLQTAELRDRVAELKSARIAATLKAGAVRAHEPVSGTVVGNAAGKLAK